jgi:hypothetical protein
MGLGSGWPVSRSHAAQPTPPRDAWFTVTGTFHGVGTDGTPELDATSIEPQQAPIDPYE